MIAFLISLFHSAHGGPIMAGSAIALCYTACNAGFVACLAGVVTAPFCPVVQGACMAACFTSGLSTAVLPTP